MIASELDFLFLQFFDMAPPRHYYDYDEEQKDGNDGQYDASGNGGSRSGSTGRS